MADSARLAPMQRARDPTAVLRQSTWLIGMLLGVLAALGYASHEAAHPKHRHVIDGQLIAHDHLDAGPHGHASEDQTTPLEEEGPEQPSTDDQFYLGQTTSPTSDEPDDRLAIAKPEGIGRAAKARSHVVAAWPALKCPPGRGPPSSAAVVS